MATCCGAVNAAWMEASACSMRALAWSTALCATRILSSASATAARRASTVCVRGVGVVHRRIVDLLRNFILVHQHFVPNHIVRNSLVCCLGFAHIGLGSNQTRPGRAQLALGAQQRRYRVHFAGTRRGQLAAGGGRSDGYIGAIALVAGLGGGQVRVGLIERDSVVLGIDTGQHVAGFHVPLIVDRHIQDVAIDPRADRVDVAVDLSVISVFVRAEILPGVKRAGGHCGQGDQRAQSRERAFYVLYVAPRGLLAFRRGRNPLAACLRPGSRLT